jgi:hypothetical protein
MEAFLTKYAESEQLPQFNCSTGFIKDFQARNSFSPRHPHYKRRPNIDSRIEHAWLGEMGEVMVSTANLDRVVNYDETCLRIYPDGLRTWAPSGSDHVAISIASDEKESFMALCSITAARQKLPIVMIAKGKSTRAEKRQFGEIEPHIPMHSESGWIKIRTFEKYLQMLKRAFPGDEPIHLILDYYSVHLSQEIRSDARDLGKNIKFIPAGTTDCLQPLDRAVFGTLKASARRMFRIQTTDYLCPRLAKQLAAQFLCRAWEQVITQVLDQAWTIYKPDDDE